MGILTVSLLASAQLAQYACVHIAIVEVRIWAYECFCCASHRSTHTIIFNCCSSTSPTAVHFLLETPSHGLIAVSYTHLTLPTNRVVCRSRWSPYH